MVTTEEGDRASREAFTTFTIDVTSSNDWGELTPGSVNEEEKVTMTAVGFVGIAEGRKIDGIAVGRANGLVMGIAVGRTDGNLSIGLCVGISDGDSVGRTDGLLVGGIDG